MTPFEDFVVEVKSMLEWRASQFDVLEDDFMPSCVFSGPDTGTAIAVFDSEFLKDDAAKDLLAVRMSYLAGKNRCNLIAFTTSSWMSRGPSAKGRVRPSEDAAREDVVTAFISEKPPGPKMNGREAFLIAPVLRAPPRVTIGVWERIDDDVGGFAGRFPDALRIALAISEVYPSIDAVSRSLGLSAADADHYAQRSIARFIGVDPDLVKQGDYVVVTLDAMRERRRTGSVPRKS